MQPVARRNMSAPRYPLASHHSNSGACALHDSPPSLSKTTRSVAQRLPCRIIARTMNGGGMESGNKLRYVAEPLSESGSQFPFLQSPPRYGTSEGGGALASYGRKQALPSHVPLQCASQAPSHATRILPAPCRSTGDQTSGLTVGPRTAAAAAALRHDSTSNSTITTTETGSSPQPPFPQSLVSSPQEPPLTASWRTEKEGRDARAVATTTAGASRERPALPVLQPAAKQTHGRHGETCATRSTNELNSMMTETTELSSDAHSHPFASPVGRPRGATLGAPPGAMVPSSATAGAGSPPVMPVDPIPLSPLNSYEMQEVRAYATEVYFTGSATCQKILGHYGLANNDGYDDEQCHYRVVVGDHLAYRYEVLQELGKGTFGVVVKAFDHKRKEQVAIKIIKNKTAYFRQAREEVKVLELMRRDDPGDHANIVRIRSYFKFRNHFTIVFELLARDLYSLCQANKFAPMPMSFLIDFARQVLTALAFARARRVVHCDIKPENIVLCEECTHGVPRRGHSRLKLIDFGSACLEGKQVYTYIQSRYYRAPEVVLGVPYTAAIDMWSFGCVLCELANGYPIFPATSESDLLERVAEYLGPCPAALIKKGKHAHKFYDNEGHFIVGVRDRSYVRIPGTRKVQNFLRSSTSESETLLADFVLRCLEYDPEQRITPAEALNHPWLTHAGTFGERRVNY